MVARKLILCFKFKAKILCFELFKDSQNRSVCSFLTKKNYTAIWLTKLDKYSVKIFHHWRECKGFFKHFLTDRLDSCSPFQDQLCVLLNLWYWKSCTWSWLVCSGQKQITILNIMLPSSCMAFCQAFMVNRF